jgi:hypothetical protein
MNSKIIFDGKTNHEQKLREVLKTVAKVVLKAHEKKRIITLEIKKDFIQAKRPTGEVGAFVRSETITIKIEVRPEDLPQEVDDDEQDACLWLSMR